MSGSGGYYKYRCKYWLTQNCPYWVWVNNAPCANCLADGRESESILTTNSFRISREICVPQFEDGFLQYMSTEIVATSDVDIGWAIHVLPARLFEKAVEGPAMQSIVAMRIIDT